MDKEEIIALLYTKHRLDKAIYEIIDKDINGLDYNKIMIALRKAAQEVYNIEMNYLVKKGHVSI